MAGYGVVTDAATRRKHIRIFMRPRRVATLAAFVASAFVWFGLAHAQSAASEASERSIKAAFLYKFAEYVDWPAPPTDEAGPFTIGVLGSNALAEDLLRMTADRMVDRRPVRVRRVSADDAIDDLQVLFIAKEESDRLGALLSPARGRPILTVTEWSGALSDGSIINFTVMGERVRFEVSLTAAESSRLRLSSRLLAVAENVYGRP